MKSQNFWDKEYKKPEHLALSTEQSEDLEKFTRWLSRNADEGVLQGAPFAVDMGCGNGRNLLFLAREFGFEGIGYDISKEAVGQARKAAADLPVTFEVRSIADTIPVENESVDIVLDMMVSHVLNIKEREALRTEVLRVLKPGGFYFLKSFLLEEDLNAKRMLRDYPAGEVNTYMHPELKVAEHVWTIEELKNFFEPHFEIKKIEKSHKHLLHGRAFKRRSVIAYLEKPYRRFSEN